MQTVNKSISILINGIFQNNIFLILKPCIQPLYDINETWGHPVVNIANSKLF